VTEQHKNVSAETPEQAEARREARIRQLAGRRGFRVSKGRGQTGLDNQGQFMLANENNHIVLGDKFDASLDEIEAFLRNEARES
jgi:hypothetical protein